MTKIVELVGPPGVGKSTLYNAMFNKWLKESNWIPDVHLLSSHAGQKIKYNSFKDFAISVAKKLTGKPDNNVLNAAAQRFVDQYPAFMDFIWENIYAERRISHKKAKDLRFDTTMLIYDRIQKTQILIESASEKIILNDEGIINWITPIIHKAGSFDEEESSEHKIISQMYLPDALIYILCDAKENAKRLLNRKRIIRRHRGLDLSELEYAAQKDQEKRNQVIDIYERIGVPVLRINSDNNIDANVLKIISFFDHLKSSEKKRFKEKIYCPTTIDNEKIQFEKK